MKRKSLLLPVICASVLVASAIGWKSTTTEIPLGILTGQESIQTDSTSAGSLFEEYVTSIYQAADLGNNKLDFNIFKKALVGYLNLKHSNQVLKPMLTIVDFTRSSKEKRMWIIDLSGKKLLFNTLVAHGQGSGDDMAQSFSNTTDTHQSSLGFYVTDNTYSGKHGLSLRLIGMDKGYNSNAYSRAIVLHGAEYVSQEFINQHGRLGRSFGCPAVPVELTNQIIETVKGKSCIFINGSDNSYKSPFLNQDTAISDIVTPDLVSQSKI